MIIFFINNKRPPSGGQCFVPELYGYGSDLVANGCQMIFDLGRDLNLGRVSQACVQIVQNLSGLGADALDLFTCGSYLLKLLLELRRIGDGTGRGDCLVGSVNDLLGTGADAGDDLFCITNSFHNVLFLLTHDDSSNLV